MPNPFHLSLVVSADCTEYGLAGEEFTVNAAGQSYISYADYAIAVVDEAEQAAHVGERAQVIVDGIEETEDGAELIGHAWFQAPDSDGAVHLDASEASVGDILTVEFTDSFCYELIGHVVE